MTVFMIWTVLAGIGLYFFVDSQRRQKEWHLWEKTVEGWRTAGNAGLKALMSRLIQPGGLFVAASDGGEGSVGPTKRVLFRQQTPLDAAGLASLNYRLIENGDIPMEIDDGFRREFIEPDPSRLHLIAEIDNKIVACGGIRALLVDGGLIYSLYYGFVDPAFRNRGLGTAMLLARLSRITMEVPFTVSLCTLPAGQRLISKLPVESTGESMDFGGGHVAAGSYVVLHPSHPPMLRDFLSRMGIMVPDVSIPIPTPPPR